MRVVSRHPSERVGAYWSAVAYWLAKDRCFARFAASYLGPATDLLPVGTDFQRDPSLSAAEAVRRVGCSFATAWTVVRDFELLHGPINSRLSRPP